MLHVITIGLSAFLLFLMQPMIAKIILPDFGGGSSIWLTSLIFYQLLLLGGYAFSHLAAGKLKPLKQGVIYFFFIVLGLLFIPVKLRLLDANLHPVLHIFVLLLASIGPLYFLLSTTSPTVQYWRAAEKKKGNPYILYAVSNAGSLAGLLCYPTLIEPNITNSVQTTILSWGFVVYAALLAVSLGRYLKKANNLASSWVPATAGVDSMKDGSPGDSNDQITWQQRLNWMGRAMIPSAALMVFTQYLSVDIVNFPLLWVIPLTLYLVSFVVVFLSSGVSKPSPTRTFIIIIPVLAMTLALRSEFQVPFAWKILATCACLFSICMFFHANLERAKPAPMQLTAFYLYLSLGACIGSFFTGIIAPLIFKSNFELYIVIILSFYLILLPYFKRRRKKLKVFFQVAAAFLLVWVFIVEEFSHHHFIIYKTRSFYGTYTIRQLPLIPGKHIAAKILSHGTTIHGGEARDSQNHLMPISYFHQGTGVGKAFSRLTNLKNIGVVGLGTGMVALYAKPGQTFDFFEIDPTVVRIAENKFANLRSSPAKIRHFIGDARLELQKVPDDSYDMMILDAFTSGAIPTHLLTKEAMQEYNRVLRKDGVILFHITNRYVNLLPVLNCAARNLGFYIKYHQCSANPAIHYFSARWVILAKTQDRFEQVTAGNSEWKTLPNKYVCWTDDFSNLWSVIDLSN